MHAPLVGPECRPTRLARDTMAWMVLEELVLEGELIDARS